MRRGRPSQSPGEDGTNHANGSGHGDGRAATLLSWLTPWSWRSVSSAPPSQPVSHSQSSSFDWHVDTVAAPALALTRARSSLFSASPDVYAVPFIISDQIFVAPYVPRPIAQPPAKQSDRSITVPVIDGDNGDGGECDPPSPPNAALVSLYDIRSLALGRHWQQWLSPLSLSRHFPPSLYVRLIHTPNRHVTNIIKDITRTFPQHRLFADSKMRHMLFDVLVAYANYDQSVGYSQGMAFIVGFLLLHVSDECTVFWMFTQLMDDSKYSLRSFYTEDCQSLRDTLALCQSLLDTDAELVALSRHLRKENIEVTVFVTQWLVTVYSYRFPEPFTQAVWNLFIERGHAVLIAVCLALFHHLQPILVRLSFEQIIPYVTNMQDTPVAVVGVAQHIRFSDNISARIEQCKASDKRSYTVQL